MGKIEYNSDNTHAAMLREESRSNWKICTVHCAAFLHIHHQ